MKNSNINKKLLLILEKYKLRKTTPPDVREFFSRTHYKDRIKIYRELGILTLWMFLALYLKHIISNINITICKTIFGIKIKTILIISTMAGLSAGGYYIYLMKNISEAPPITIVDNKKTQLVTRPLVENKPVKTIKPVVEIGLFKYDNNNQNSKIFIKNLFKGLNRSQQKFKIIKHSGGSNIKSKYFITGRLSKNSVRIKLLTSDTGALKGIFQSQVGSNGDLSSMGNKIGEKIGARLKRLK